MLKESIDVADGWRLVPMNMIDNSSPDALSRKVAANKKSEEALAEFRYYVLGMMQKASILEPWGFFHETWEFYKKGKRNISREKIDRLFESLNAKSDSPVRNLLTNIENIDDSKDLSFCNSALYCLVRFNKKFDYFSQILQAIESEYLSSKKKKTKDINNVQKLRSGEECLLKIFNKQINRYPTKEIETCVTKYENGEYKSFCPYCLSNEEKILEDSPLEGYFDVDSGGVILINTLRNCKQTECFYLRASDTRRLIDKQGLSEGSDRKVKARIIFNEGTKIVDSEVLLSSRNQRHVFHFNFKLDEGFSLNHAQHGFEDSNPVICISKSKQKEGFDEYGFDLNVLPQEWYKNNSAKCKQYFKIAFPEPCEDL